MASLQKVLYLKQLLLFIWARLTWYNLSADRQVGYREVKHAYHPAAEDGGDGVTVVEF